MTASPSALRYWAAAAALALVGGCSGTSEHAAATDRSTEAHGVGQGRRAQLPGEAGHVHGAALGTDGASVLVATHSGLYKVSSSSTSRVGPAIDLMGFTPTAAGTLLASGHPLSPTAGLRDPAGLIKSNDEGRTWHVVSRAGESDFHALTSIGRGAVGFDGALLWSPDLLTWGAGSIAAAPYALAASPAGAIVVATTEAGLQRSSDGGRTFSSVGGAPLLLLVVHDGSQRFVGVTPNGQVWASYDGLSWAQIGDLAGQQPEALAASGSRVCIVAGGRVLVSDDAGRTFEAM